MTCLAWLNATEYLCLCESMKSARNVACLQVENVKEIMPYTVGVNVMEISAYAQLGIMRPTSGKYDLYCIFAVQF